MPVRDQNEDLFEDSRMSFGEHLEELRKVLIRSLAGVAVCCVLGFFLAESVVQILQTPLENALTTYYVRDGKEKLRAEHGYVAPELSYLLDSERSIPETVMVDPGELVGALRAVSPDFLANVSLKPYRFTPENFDPERTAQMCRDWSNMNTQREEVKQQWKLMWDLLDSSDRDKIIGIGAAQQISSDDLKILTAVMNRLLVRNEIHESEAFAPMIEKPVTSFSDVLSIEKENPLLEMKQQLDLHFAPDLSQRINRLLISRSLGPAISEVRIGMVPLTVWKSGQFKAQSLGATETFMIWLKAGVVTGLILASPWVFFQLWTFVAAGLYPAEQRYIYVFLPISLVLFFSGALLAFFFVFEPVLEFLFSFNARMGISPQPRINDWLSFVMFLPLGFGIAFQLPLVMLFANRIDLISLDAFTSQWRVAIVAIFGISMLLTPADPVSMVMLAIPLTGLYFLGILLCRWFNKPANPYGYSAE